MEAILKFEITITRMSAPIIAYRLTEMWFEISDG